MDDLAFSLANRLIEKLISIASEEICLAWGVKAMCRSLDAPCRPSKTSSWMPKRSKHITVSYAVGYNNLKMCSLMRRICWTSLSAKLCEGKWFMAVAQIERYAISFPALIQLHSACE
ncbi:hypothetical protein ACFX2I_014280 [Malus domestica]